ncbi:MAG: ABC transporter ATP-binding protein [Desulfobacteraceae bacterium]|jgi:branched-chain amino acid transport system ATP-binding protein|nr:MAG: ABC transporter ATP-binding protein [Desulfobacteraceae bacterium]
MLKVNNIEVVFDRFYLVLKGISLEVPEKGKVAFLGSNGAGKSTVLKAIAGLLKSERGLVTDGMIDFLGIDVTNEEPRKTVDLGISTVPEGGGVFEQLSVEENLMIGMRRGRRRDIRANMAIAFQYFPALIPHAKKLAGLLSGGEQQMVAIGRSLMSIPRLMLLDEPSLGLAPLLVKSIFNIIDKINRERGVAILLVEQNANVALNMCQYGYIMENGKIVMDGKCSQLMENEDVRDFYLGMKERDEKTRFHNIKHYKRRKRWLS